MYIRAPAGSVCGFHFHAELLGSAPVRFSLLLVVEPPVITPLDFTLPYLQCTMVIVIGTIASKVVNLTLVPH
jgi:hypothetical protein